MPGLLRVEARRRSDRRHRETVAATPRWRCDDAGACSGSRRPGRPQSAPALFRPVLLVGLGAVLACTGGRPSTQPGGETWRPGGPPAVAAPAEESGPLPGSPVEGPLRVVLVTFEGLRLDALSAHGGVASVTPNLHRLEAEADWVGPAIAASSFAPASLASLWTGLQPWRHGVLHWAQRSLDPAAVTLAERFAEEGFHTEAWRDLLWLQDTDHGFRQGFGSFRWLRNLRRLGDSLSPPPAGDEFFWIGVRRPALPYERDARLLEQVAPHLPVEEFVALPERVGFAQVAGWFDPEAELPAPRARELRRLHEINLARADRVLGAVLEQLIAADGLASTLLVVTSTNGESLGEGEPAGNVSSGSSLTPEQVVVPILVRLPGVRGEQAGGAMARSGSSPAPIVGLAELAEGLPRLARAVRAGARSSGAIPWPPAAGAPLLAELYLRDGANQVALYGRDWFLLRSERFAPPPEGAWRRRIVGHVEPELLQSFRAAPPLGAGFGTADRSCRPPRCSEQAFGWRAVGHGIELSAEPAASSDGTLELAWLRLNGVPATGAAPVLVEGAVEAERSPARASRR
ncbi:MAG: hypothetical protein DWQ36_23430 [Acidobacteria bacterium]|nr:MAG: hypothetical protein DWQ36_23430 [Acidobacteriota bacterium]